MLRCIDYNEIQDWYKIEDDSDGDVFEAEGDDIALYVKQGIDIEGLPATFDKYIPVPKSANMRAARAAKNDEYYTRLVDIEEELGYYNTDCFQDAVIYCPTDVVAEDAGTGVIQSRFVQYFQMRKNVFHFKKLIATCLETKGETWKNKYILERKLSKYSDPESPDYDPSITDEDDRYYDWVETFDFCAVDAQWGSGDFRSEECLSILDEADYVLTNPPFSLFHEFFNVLMERNVKFWLIGNMNSVAYKEVVLALKDRKVFLGRRVMNKGMCFDVSEQKREQLRKTKKEGQAYKIVDGEVKAHVTACWFTNVEDVRRVDYFDMLTIEDWQKRGVKYQYFDNSDILNVDKVAQIPEDFEGIMGVPITFFDKWNYRQFTIIGLILNKSYYGDVRCYSVVNGYVKYVRLLIHNNDYPLNLEGHYRDPYECTYEVSDTVFRCVNYNVERNIYDILDPTDEVMETCTAEQVQGYLMQGVKITGLPANKFITNS